jgi:hypothetical protein
MYGGNANAMPKAKLRMMCKYQNVHVCHFYGMVLMKYNKSSLEDTFINLPNNGMRVLIKDCVAFEE